MKNDLRLTKMHSYSSITLTDRIYPYYFQSETVFNREDVTVMAFITQNRFDDLIRLADMWKGITIMLSVNKVEKKRS